MNKTDSLITVLIIIAMCITAIPMAYMIGNSFYSEYKIFMVKQEIVLEKKKQELAEIKKGEQE